MALPELHADLFSRHANPLYVLFSGGRRKSEVKMLYPTRLVVDATENSNPDLSYEREGAGDVRRANNITGRWDGIQTEKK